MTMVCPRCLEAAVIRFDLNDGSTCTCTECEEEFAVNDVRHLIASWGPVLTWIDTHPAKRAAG